MDDNAAPREERVPVAIHQHALHGRLREPRPLCARTSHAGAFASPVHPSRPAALPAPVCSGEAPAREPLRP
uniref:Uncharacterized protein n=1 Tax=Corvus moneduloides TaxID=1196302 RepID=A0A8C3E6U6_CORMO